MMATRTVYWMAVATDGPVRYGFWHLKLLAVSCVFNVQNNT